MLPATFDHLVIAVPDLAESVEQCEAVLGIRPVPGGVHPGLGTANVLLGLDIGGTRARRAYLEILGPDPDQDPQLSAPRLGGVIAPIVQRWAIHPSDFDGAVAAALEAQRAWAARPASERAACGRNRASAGARSASASSACTNRRCSGATPCRTK
mgnify:CR=1 FL=1